MQTEAFPIYPTTQTLAKSKSYTATTFCEKDVEPRGKFMESRSVDMDMPWGERCDTA